MAEESSTEDKIRVYKYRWVALGIFCLFTIINFAQFIQFSIIANIVTKFYNVESFAIDLTGLIFFIAYIVAFLPVGFLIEKYSLKITAITSTGLTLLGNLLKLLCAKPENFWIVYVAQGLCAIGQVYMISIPSKFASVWFGSEEVSTACAIAVLGTQLGVAIGAVLPTFLVENNENTDKIGEQLYHMFTYNAIVTAVIFFIVAAFFRARPQLPPSQSQLTLLENDEQEPFFKMFQLLMRKKDVLLLLVSFGLCNGIWNSFGILLNNFYLNYFPGGESDAGIIALISIIAGGCIGSVIFGLILDKTHQFKKTSFLVLLGSSLSYILVVYVLTVKHRIGSFIVIPVFGFFTASTLVIGFEFVLEVSYPIPESCSCSVLNATIYVFAIVVTLVLEWLFQAIGYLYSFVVILAALLTCCVTVLFVSKNLRRRDANLAKNTTNEGNLGRSSSSTSTIQAI